jgi:hypothetical protein
MCASIQGGKKEKDDVAASVLLAFEDGEAVAVLVLVPEQQP